MGVNEDAIYRAVFSARYESAISDASGIIESIGAHAGRVAVAVSGGKDSTAMAHIALTVLPVKPLLVWNDSGLELPESEAVVRSLAARLGCRLAIATGKALDIKRKLGGFGAEKKARRTDELAIIYPVRELLRAEGMEVNLVGLREQESYTRKMVIRKMGPTYQSKRWGCLVGWPMRRWSAADVFAYIDEHDLPLHPAYTRTDWADRNSIRVSWLWDSTRERFGDIEYLRRYYPKIWAQLKSEGLI